MPTKPSSSRTAKPVKRLLAVVLILLVLLLAFVGSALFFSPEFHWLGKRMVLSEQLTHVLMDLGTTAARNGDVPVAAVVLYGDSIIGRGFNTVVRDKNAAGHAEINAISDALARVGLRQFRELQRDSLVLVSTLEPCPMCRGAILEYGIRRVIFLKSRSFAHWSRQVGKQLRYEWEKKKGTDEALQDSLFRRHPAFDPAHVEF